MRHTEKLKLEEKFAEKYCYFLCWLHSVGQNHFYVMFLLSQGCCFIQSLLFGYVLQEDSVKFSRKFILVPCQPSGRRGIPSGRSSVSNIRLDDENFPSGCPSVSRSFEQFKIASVRTLFRVRKDPSVPAYPSGCHSVLDKY
jgi:hypothetical protein